MRPLASALDTFPRLIILFVTTSREWVCAVAKGCIKGAVVGGVAVTWQGTTVLSAPLQAAQ